MTDYKGHVFTTAGFSDDATCDNCGMGILQFKDEPKPCPKPDPIRPDPAYNKNSRDDSFDDVPAIEPIIARPDPVEAEIDEVLLLAADIGAGLAGVEYYSHEEAIKDRDWSKVREALSALLRDSNRRAYKDALYDVGYGYPPIEKLESVERKLEAGLEGASGGLDRPSEPAK